MTRDRASRGQTLATFLAAAFEYRTTPTGLHADAETMGLFTAAIVWLKRALHGWEPLGC
jgi:hypothetical protein